MAQVSFSSILKSSAANQEEESNDFTGSRLTGARNISFTSADPAQTAFTGNNVPGVLKYELSGTTYSIHGIVSRLFKDGSTYEGFYFIETGNDYALGRSETSNAYALIWPSQEAAFPTSPGTYPTSSDPVDTGLEALRAAQPTLVGITQNDADLAIQVGQVVTYTFSFSADIDAATFTSADLLNTGTAGVTFGTISEVSPGVFTVQVTATSAGTVTLGIAQGAVITTPTGLGFNTATQILDDQTLTASSITVSNVQAADAAATGLGDTSVVEGDTLRYAVTLSGTTAVVTELPLTLSGTAASVDYGTLTFTNGVTYNPTSGKITVPAGVSSFDVVVPTVDDTDVELTETLVVNVGGVSSTGTITDNDVLAVASVTAEDAASVRGSGDSTVVEGGTLHYAVTLNATTVAPTQFTLAVSGTAAAADYSAFTFTNGVTYDPGTGRITVPEGVRSFEIVAPTVDDSGVELTERLTLNVGGVASTGTIIDNDVPTIGSVTAEDAATARGSGDSAVIEGNTLRYAVSLSDTTVAPTEFTLAVSGTAIPADYSA